MKSKITATSYEYFNSACIHRDFVMKYYPATNRTVFEYLPSLESPTTNRDFVFQSRPLLDGQFQRGLTADTPFTVTEPFDMHVSRART